MQRSIKTMASSLLVLLVCSVSIVHGKSEPDSMKSLSKDTELDLYKNNPIMKPNYQTLFNFAFAGLQHNTLNFDKAKTRKIQVELLYLKILEMLKKMPQTTFASKQSKNFEKDDAYSKSYNSCLADLNWTMISARERQLWALEMLDAVGKPSSGILMGNVIYPGDYDECLIVTTNQTFETIYCSASITLSAFDHNHLDRPMTFTFGLCVPDSCDDQLIKDIIDTALSTQNNITANVTSSVCKSKTVPLSTLAIAVICVCSVVTCVLFIATLYDILYMDGVWHQICAKREINAVPLDLEVDRGVLTFANRGHELSYEAPFKVANKEPKEVHSLAAKLLLAFSAYTNGPKVLSTEQSSGSIKCINGIKFISLTWVILGHCILMGLVVASDSKYRVILSYKRWTFMAVSHAWVSVDTFFVLSGCLMTYLVMQKLYGSRPTPGFFVHFYLHRIWRLTPAYMLILMTYVGLYKYISDGPFWPQEGFEKDDCRDTWWTNLLYINNFVWTDKLCMPWSWYLSNEMQFYVVSPLVFLPLFYFGWKAFAVPCLFLLVTAVISGVISHCNELPASVNFLNGLDTDYFTVYYIKPYTRIGPYILGMVTGYFIHRCKCNIRIPKVLVVVGWMTATAVGLAVVYGLFEDTNGHPISLQEASLYNALHRIGWGMAVSWVIFACATGYGGFINIFLSWKLFVPLSRLTLCAYLVHPMVIYFFVYSQRTLISDDNISLSFLFVGAVTLSYAVAFVVSLAYESPWLGVEKVLRSYQWSTIKVPSQAPDVQPIVT